MEKLLQQIIEKAKTLNCRWADIRYTKEEGEIISLKNSEIEKLATYQKEGVGVRVLVNNGWGFFSTNQMDYTSLENALLRAYEIAVISDQKSREKVEFEKFPPQKGKYQTEFSIDPFSLEMDYKISFLKKSVEKMLQVEGIKIA